MSINKKYACPDCDAMFTVKHDEPSNPEFCPFCSASLIDDDIYSDDDDSDEY